MDVCHVNIILELYCCCFYLDAIFVDVSVMAAATPLCFAEQNEILEDKDLAQALPASLPHQELVLT